MAIDIVLVNWNAGSQLAEAVTSIIRYHHGLVSSVIIVDNASSDDSLARVEALGNLPFPIQIVRNTENRGFGAACNQGAALAGSEYLLFLNPDAAFYKNTLPKTLAYMQNPSNATVGICGVQLLDEVGKVSRSCARFPTALGFMAHATGLNRLFPRLGHVMAEWDHGQTRQVDHVIGAFFLVRRDLFEMLGGFDERFFVYLEDVDFSYRVRRAGWHSVYLADVQAFHAGGGTSGRVKAKRLFYSLQSRLLYGFKHFRPWQAWGLLFTTVIVEPWSRLAFALLRGSWSDARHTAQGYAILLRALPGILRLASDKRCWVGHLESRERQDIRRLLPLLLCPQCCRGPLVIEVDSRDLHCACCETSYPITHGRPVLLRPDNEVFCLDDYRHAALASPEVSVRGWGRFVPAPSVNLASERVLGRVAQSLVKLPSATVLVVGGGRQRQWLDERLGAGGSVRVVYSDIDVGADVDIFCDGHNLPFADAVFDAVITTAVLEHVLYPEQVAAEIHRVLKVGGVLYSELPFMQQVHEGAYDFTRYTLSGHRRLFNGFAEIESGMVAGPGTALVWAIENFVLAFVARPGLRKVAKALVRLVFSWLKHFDRLLVNRAEAMDAASCTYFLGRKIEGHVPDVEIITRYVGAKHLRHT